MKPSLTHLVRLFLFACLLIAPSAAQTPEPVAQALPPSELNITIGEQRLKFAPTRAFQEIRLNVFNHTGELVYGAASTEAEMLWNVRDHNGAALAPGLYSYVVTLKYAESETPREQRGHFVIEKGQDQIWLTNYTGAELTGGELTAARTGGRSIAGLQRSEGKSVKRDVSGRELVDDQGNKLAEAKDDKKAKQEKAALLGTQNKVAKFGAGGAADTDSAITEVGGNVGINTTAPTGALEIYTNAVNPVQVQMDGVNAALTMQLDNYGLSGGPTSGSGFLGRAANGTKAAPTDVISGNRLGFNVFGGWAGGAFRHVAAINAHVGSGTVSVTSLPSYLNFMTTPDGSVSRVERMRINQNGNVGIGTANPLAKLHAESTSDISVYGKSTSGVGVYGASTSNWGVLGLSTSSDGMHGASSSGAGVSGDSASNYGVRGNSNSGDGVYGQSNSGTGVVGTSGSGTGVVGTSDSFYGVYAYSDFNVAVYAVSGDNTAMKVIGNGAGHGLDVFASGSGYAVYAGRGGHSAGAGYFDGDVEVIGNVMKSGGSFKIDHPLDPENKYLYHSFVESPDMMNIYNGVATLGEFGAVEITLPDWFETLNSDYRYQLTAIGMPGPNLFVAEEIKGNQFKVAGGSPGMKVSWQVTGIRQDAYARKHRIPVEEAKPEKERGTYLHPAAFDQPEEKGVNWERDAQHRERREADLKNAAAPLSTKKP